MTQQYSSLDTLAHELTYNSKTRKNLFSQLPLGERSALFGVLSPHVLQEILSLLPDADAVKLLDHLDPYHVHQILGRMRDSRRRNRIIKLLKKDIYAKVERFLQFHPHASVSIFHLNYVLLSTDTTVGDTAEVIEKHLHETGKIPAVLVAQEGELLGEVPLNTLVRESNRRKIAQFVRPVLSITYTAEKKSVIELFRANYHRQVVVLDTDGSVLGIMYSDDVIELIESAPAAALYDFAGVSESEKTFDSTRSKVRHRYKWLIINLGTAFLAAFVVGLFENTLSQLVVLAVYMPVVAGMGGNAATQTLAVMVRGITLGEITLKNSAPAIKNEVLAGLTNGVITGLIVAAVATFWNGDPLLGLVLAVAMIFNLVIAGFFGALIPLVMKAVGKDPATSATIFITTATDVFGFFAFLGLATLLLL